VVVIEFPSRFVDARGGNEKLLQFFVSQVMRHARSVRSTAAQHAAAEKLK